MIKKNSVELLYVPTIINIMHKFYKTVKLQWVFLLKVIIKIKQFSDFVILFSNVDPFSTRAGDTFQQC